MAAATVTLEEFGMRYGGTVTTALNVYIRDMREAASEAQTAYDAIKDDPAQRAAQDKTFMTTMGLFHSARAFNEAADRAQEALDAYLTITEGEDEDI